MPQSHHTPLTAKALSAVAAAVRSERALLASTAIDLRPPALKAASSSSSYT